MCTAPSARAHASPGRRAVAVAVASVDAQRILTAAASIALIADTHALATAVAVAGAGGGGVVGLTSVADRPRAVRPRKPDVANARPAG